MNLFDINSIAITVLDYPISYIELIGTVFGLFATIYASRAHVFTWISALISSVFLLMLFYQVQLYANLILQIYFISISVYGWLKWNSRADDNKISRLNQKTRLFVLLEIMVFSGLAGLIISKIHLLLPDIFPEKSAYPYADAFILVTSVVANFLLAKKKIENWYLWIINDLACVALFYQQGVYFLMIEYIIFLGLALYGISHWNKSLKLPDAK
jgi:nicotinamide mononucleotide transporter